MKKEKITPSKMKSSGKLILGTVKEDEETKKEISRSKTLKKKSTKVFVKDEGSREESPVLEKRTMTMKLEIIKEKSHKGEGAHSNEPVRKTLMETMESRIHSTLYSSVYGENEAIPGSGRRTGTMHQ